MLTRTNTIWRSLSPARPLVASSSSALSPQSLPLSPPSTCSFSSIRFVSSQILKGGDAQAKRGNRSQKGEKMQQDAGAPWTGSGFSGMTSSSDGRGNLANRDDVILGRNQAQEVTGEGAEWQQPQQPQQQQGKSQEMGMRQDALHRHPQNQHQAWRPYSTGKSSTTSTSKQSSSSGFPSNFPSTSSSSASKENEVQLDRGQGMTGKDSFGMDERGKQVKTDSASYGSPKGKGAEKFSAAMDSFPADSKNPPSKKEASTTPGTADFPSPPENEQSQHFGKDYSGTPHKDLSKSMKEGLDESVRMQHEQSAAPLDPSNAADSSFSADSSTSSASDSSRMEAAKQAEKGAGRAGREAGKMAREAGRKLSQDSGKDSVREAGKMAREAGNEAGKMAREAGKAGKEAGKEALSRKNSQPIRDVLSSLGSSIKVGIKSLLGANPSPPPSNQPPRNL